MGKKIELKIHVSQLVFQEHYVLFKWENTPLLLPRQDFPIPVPDVVWEHLEYFKTALPGQLCLTLTFPWFKAGIEFSQIHLSPAEVQKIKESVASINTFIQTIQAAIEKKELDLATLQSHLKAASFHLEILPLHQFLSHVIDHMPPQQVMEPLLVPLSSLDYLDTGIRFSFNGMLLEIHNPNLPFTATTYAELIKHFLTGDLTVEFQRERVVKWNPELGKLETIEVPLKIGGTKLPRICLTSYESAIQNLVKIERELKIQAEKNALTRETAAQLFRDNGFKGEFARFNPIIASLINQMPPQELTIPHTVLPAQLIPRPDGALFKYRSMYFTIYDSQLKLELYHFPPEFIQFIDGQICAMMKIRRYITWDVVASKLNYDKIVLEVESVTMDPAEFDAFQRQKFMIAAIAQELDLLIAKNRLTLDKAAELFKNLEYQLSSALLNRFLKRYIDEGPQVVSSETKRIPLAQLEYGPEQVLFRYQGLPYPISSQLFPFELGPILEEIKPQLPGAIDIFFLHFFHRHWDTVTGEIIVEETAQNLGKWEIPEETLNAFLHFRQTAIITAIHEMIAAHSFGMGKMEDVLMAWGLNFSHRPIADAIIAQVPPWEKQTLARVHLKDILYGKNEITVTVPPNRLLRIPTQNTPIKSAPSLDHIKQVFKGYLEVLENNPHRFFWYEKMGRLDITNGPISTTFTMDEETRQLFLKMTTIFVDLCDMMGAPAAIAFVTSPRFDFNDPKAIPHTDEELHQKGYDPIYVRELIDMAQQVFPTQDDLWFKINNRLIWERPIHGAATYVFKWPAQPLKRFMGSVWAYPTLHEIASQRATTGYLGKAIHSTLYDWKINLHAIINRHD